MWTFYLLLKIYLGMSGLHCGMQALSLLHVFSSLWHMGFSLVVRGLSSCGTQALVRMGLVAPLHVGS